MKHWTPAVFALILAGCGEVSIEEPVPPHDTNVVHEDLPAPQGFTFEGKNPGNTSPTGAFRVLKQQLRGTRPVQDAAAFYRTVYPTHGWTLVRDEAASGGRDLAFVKKSEQCAVEIREQPGSTTTTLINLKVERKE